MVTYHLISEVELPTSLIHASLPLLLIEGKQTTSLGPFQYTGVLFYLINTASHFAPGLLHKPGHSTDRCHVKRVTCCLYEDFVWYTRWIRLLQEALPLHVWSGSKGSRKLRFPDFTTMAQDGGKFVSLTHRSPLPPGNIPGTNFC